MTFFVNNFIGAALASVLSLISITIGFGRNMDIIIIGSIMSLVPGVAITNALRDTISGTLYQVFPEEWKLYFQL